ncbi:hypothetical protein LG293_17300 (plasmid) [Citricoccus nitrophenolicus]
MSAESYESSTAYSCPNCRIVDTEPGNPDAAMSHLTPEKSCPACPCGCEDCAPIQDWTDDEDEPVSFLDCECTRLLRSCDYQCPEAIQGEVFGTMGAGLMSIVGVDRCLLGVGHDGDCRFQTITVPTELVAALQAGTAA